MMKLFQIVVSKADMDAANLGGEYSPQLKASRDAMCFGKFLGQQFYTHVADIEASDLDYAFQVGNIGPESLITRHAPMHSVSVGDVLVSSFGVAFIVKPFGFEAVDGWSVN